MIPTNSTFKPIGEWADLRRRNELRVKMDVLRIKDQIKKAWDLSLIQYVVSETNTESGTPPTCTPREYTAFTPRDQIANRPSMKSTPETSSVNSVQVTPEKVVHERKLDRECAMRLHWGKDRSPEFQKTMAERYFENLSETRNGRN